MRAVYCYVRRLHETLCEVSSLQLESEWHLVALPVLNNGVKVITTWFTASSRTYCSSAVVCNNLTPQPGTQLKTRTTMAWVSSLVSHHLMLMRSGVTLHPTQSSTAPFLPHRVGANWTPWYDEAVTYGNTAQRLHFTCWSTTLFMLQVVLNYL